jgi:uncharacterized protein (TIGR02270 family)
MAAVAETSVPVVVQQHLDNADLLRSVRSVLVRAPHVGLDRLRRLDDRLAASLDGLAVAGDLGRRMSLQALAAPNRGTVFACAVAAIESRDPALLERLMSLTQAVPELRPGLVSAFGWVPATSLRGITRALLDSPNAFRRDVGLAACAMHHADPGDALSAAMTAAARDERPAEAAQAVVAAGKLGRRDLLSECLHGLSHPDACLRFVSARSALLLGERQASVQALTAMAQAIGPWRACAAVLVLKVLQREEADALLRSLAQDTGSARLLVRGIGAAGDVRHVPWLVDRMDDPALARLAGEAFSTITGLDLAAADLELKPPQGPARGAAPDPRDDPQDDDVAMDEDDGLPWPDGAGIGDWWQAHGARLPAGCCFAGGAVSPGHCVAVLKSGVQRQRIAAADHLALTAPGTPLFNVAAPVWRQLRLLSAMEA